MGNLSERKGRSMMVFGVTGVFYVVLALLLAWPALALATNAYRSYASPSGSIYGKWTGKVELEGLRKSSQVSVEEAAALPHLMQAASIRWSIRPSSMLILNSRPQGGGRLVLANGKQMDFGLIVTPEPNAPSKYLIQFDIGSANRNAVGQPMPYSAYAVLQQDTMVITPFATVTGSFPYWTVSGTMRKSSSSEYDSF